MKKSGYQGHQQDKNKSLKENSKHYLGKLGDAGLDLAKLEEGVMSDEDVGNIVAKF